MNRITDYDPADLHTLLESGETVCGGCSDALAVEDGMCRDCWQETNGQFGVGA